MSQRNVDLLKSGFEAWNAGDMDALRAMLHPDVIMRAPEGWPEPGPFVGAEEVMRQFGQLRETWDADVIELVGDFVDAGDRVAVRILWRGSGHGLEAGIEWTYVATVRDGGIFGLEYFWNHAEALAAVGLAEEGPDRDGARRLYAQPRNVTRVEDCFFYHVMELPTIGVVGGLWDLREGVDEYLGGIDVSGKRVLEIGPASGFITMQLESRGAEVVAHELGANEQWDLVPHHRLSIAEVQANRRRELRSLRNSFWLTHRLFGSSARVHYGSAYTLPSELGRFDFAIIASVLMHTRDPLRIIERCAELTDEAIVIVDLHQESLDGRPCAGFTRPTRTRPSTSGGPSARICSFSTSGHSGSSTPR